MDKNLNKKLNMKVRIKKVNTKTLVAAIKSRISVSFKNSDNIIFVFSKDIKAIYKDNNHLLKDKNSFTNPLDKPNKDEKIVKERKIKSTTVIKII
tara:strand:- start:548 stop:832 length:285 start_codon:yes stop_codon:yes gene_type:complete